MPRKTTPDELTSTEALRLAEELDAKGAGATLDNQFTDRVIVYLRAFVQAKAAYDRLGERRRRGHFRGGGVMGRPAPTTKEENIAAIAYGIAPLTDRHGFNFYEKHSDTLEGAIGCLRYFVQCADAFTTMETQGGVPSEYDWYLAIDHYVVAIVALNELPSFEELQRLAATVIAEAK